MSDKNLLQSLLQNITGGHTKPGGYREHFAKIITEVSQESDRGVALFSGSLLDQALEDILRTFLINCKESSKLFNYPQPLSTFSARQNMCLALGLITSEEFEICNVIRKVRNEFAHGATYDVKFDNPGVLKVLSRASVYHQSQSALGNDYRNIFVIMVIGLHWGWTERLKFAQANKRGPYPAEELGIIPANSM